MAEILAPCGGEETLSAALRTGCDAVYFGGKSFSARQNAANFTDEQIKHAVRECHKCGVKVYQAINTVIMDSRLDECASAVKYACECGVDGLITQDLALVEIVKTCCPDMEIHASTQMTLHTKRGVMIAKELGFCRAVVSRELDEKNIAELCKLPIEIEVFVHGALCMSVSGQCYMSAVIGSRSANRGLCAQACRLPFSAFDGHDGRHDLSLKDMSLLPYAKRLEKAGVRSLKIEGRMKRPEYVAASVNALRLALDGKTYDFDTLEKVFSRQGFTDGYFLHKTGKEMFGFRSDEAARETRDVLPRLHELYRHEYKRTAVFFYVKIQSGEPVSLCIEDEDGNRAEMCGDIPQTALNRPADEDYLKKQLSKLGDTIYSLSDVKAEIGDGLTVPSSQLNAMRREVCERLDGVRVAANTFCPTFKACDFRPARSMAAKPGLRISISDVSQLDKLDLDKISLVLADWDNCKGLLRDGFSPSRLALKMPRFTLDEDGDFERLSELCGLGLRAIVCTNYAHISMGRELGLVMYGGFGLNVTNTLALRQLKKLGLSDCTASFELKCSQINALGNELDFGVIGYGRLPLMLTVNCPIRQASGCEKCTGRLCDRTGRKFPVKCSRNHGYVEILNSDLLYIGDKKADFKTLSFFELDFFEESPKRAAEVVRCFEQGSPLGVNGITRGLYYRGIL